MKTLWWLISSVMECAVVLTETKMFMHA